MVTVHIYWNYIIYYLFSITYYMEKRKNCILSQEQKINKLFCFMVYFKCDHQTVQSI